MTRPTSCRSQMPRVTSHSRETTTKSRVAPRELDDVDYPATASAIGCQPGVDDRVAEEYLFFAMPASSGGPAAATWNGTNATAGRKMKV